MKSEAIELYRAGSEAFKVNDYKTAKKYLTQLTNAGHEFADALNMLGVIAYEEARFTDAKAAFNRAIEINPHYTEARLNLAVSMVDTGSYSEGETAFDEAATSSKTGLGQVDPFVKGRLSNLHADLADIYHGMGLYEDSLREYRTALKLAPHFPDLGTRMGILLRDMGLYDEAILEFKRVLELKPGYTPALVQIGITHYGEGQIDKAAALWEQALQKNPDDTQAKKYLRLLENDS
jgi:tetratricopeptide (TPR) repeat protein